MDKEVKQRFKMYKAGKQWIFAPIFFAVVGGAIALSGPTTAKADTQANLVSEKISKIAKNSDEIKTDIILEKNELAKETVSKDELNVQGVAKENSGDQGHEIQKNQKIQENKEIKK